MTIIAEGTQAAVVGTEHTLVTDTTGKVYVLIVDAGAMVGGDVLELRVYTKVRTGGVSRLALPAASYSNVQVILINTAFRSQPTSSSKRR